MPEDVKSVEELNAPEEVQIEKIKKAPAKKKAVAPSVSNSEEMSRANVPVIFQSLDGRKLEVSVNDWQAAGVRIEVPRNLEQEVSRLLKDAKFIFNTIA